MFYSMTFTEDLYQKIMDHLFTEPRVEQAAYLFCGMSRTPNEIRFLARETFPVMPEELISQSKCRLSIPSSSYVPKLGYAANTNQCFFLIHSHPEDVQNFSEIDDCEAKVLFKTAYIRINNGIHGEIVFSSQHKLSARIWLNEGETLIEESMKIVRVVGNQYKFIVPQNYLTTHSLPKPFFDRQVRAFGKQLQDLLGRLHIGVVGCGGTGSAVIEQLARLGIGQLTIVDHDIMDDTNITRIHGSSMSDYYQKRLKVDVMEDMINDIGFGTKLLKIPEKVIYEPVAKRLRECDLIFGCTDDHAGRNVLNLLSIRYYIPLIDMGVIIDSQEGNLRNIIGRVTNVHPGTACLICKKAVNLKIVGAEMMQQSIHEEMVREGYAPELGQKDPSVITFTTAVASQAVMEMLNLITGYMGQDESIVANLLCRFDSRAFSKQPEPEKHECFCTNPKVVGSGDTAQFLGITWPTMEKENMTA